MASHSVKMWISKQWDKNIKFHLLTNVFTQFNNAWVMAYSKSLKKEQEPI